jgi:A/G-specific adenine glycosylase
MGSRSSGTTSFAHLDRVALRAELLKWYKQHKRDLPWRDTSDPYCIWVSEIMLQQTRASVAAEHYRVFIQRFPTVSALAAAHEQDVLARWSGLGYYNRARNLHKAARFVMAELNGVLPKTAAELRTLPGIGSYTAAAIASIVYNEPVAVVDGNVERVIARLAGLAIDSKSKSRHTVETLASELVDPRKPGDFNQAMMELGATTCLPRNPPCRLCPIATHCETRGEHRTEPRAPMTRKDVSYALATRLRYGPECDATAADENAAKKGRSKKESALQITNKQDTKKRAKESLHREVLLVQRMASETVMPGMWELPSLRNGKIPESDLRMTVRHAIMQINYTVRIRTVIEPDVQKLIAPTPDGAHSRWVPLKEAEEMALTGLARKVLKQARLFTEKIQE